MSGKPNDKWLATMIKKLGSREKVTEWQMSIGSKGGANGNTGKGFASEVIGKDGLTGPQRASKVGSIGGKTSRRNARIIKESII